MDVREKLVELIDNAEAQRLSTALCCTVDEFIDIPRKEEYVAEYLVAHGVTVQERGYWASLTDCANAGVYCSVCHKKVYKEDYAQCNRKNKLRSDYCPHCGAKNVAPAAERRMNDDAERSN